MKPIEATFIRHAESTGNAGFATPDCVSIGLTPKGFLQARELAASWTEPPSLIVTSPYLRTQLTARPTCDRFPIVPVEVWPIQEFTYLEPSRWNGTTSAERAAAVGEYWRRGDPDYQDGPGAESFSNLLRRANEALARLDGLSNTGRVLLFSHCQFIQAIRINRLHPGWSASEKMTGFIDLSRSKPIPSADTWSLSLIRQCDAH
jgi:broad specificity phosphatase PhoE